MTHHDRVRVAPAGETGAAPSGHPDSASEVGADLQQVLVDLLDLGLLAKQVHWNVVGPRFRALHLQLDEITLAVRLQADAVAERAVTVGVAPDGRAATVSAGSRLLAGVPDGMPAGAIQDGVAIELVNAMLTRAIDGLRTAIATTAACDPVTEDLLIGVSAELEKQRWMLIASR